MWDLEGVGKAGVCVLLGAGMQTVVWGTSLETVFQVPLFLLALY